MTPERLRAFGHFLYGKLFYDIDVHGMGVAQREKPDDVPIAHQGNTTASKYLDGVSQFYQLPESFLKRLTHAASIETATVNAAEVEEDIAFRRGRGWDVNEYQYDLARKLCDRVSHLGLEASVADHHEMFHNPYIPRFPSDLLPGR